MLKRLQDHAGIVDNPPLGPSGEPEPAESSHTLSYNQWNNEQFPWRDFSEVTSAPSTSRNTGKPPMIEDHDDEFESEEDDEDEDSQEDKDYFGDDE